MDLWQALILGIIQGITEFLPISSSGHLLAAQDLLGVSLDNESLDAFDVALHLGTLAAVVTYFRRDLAEITTAGARTLRTRQVTTPHERLAWLIALGTIPAVLAYLLFKDQIQAAQDNFVLVGIMLIVVCGYFFLADRFGGERDIETMGKRQALLIGISQAAALVPGTSRSGATIATGMLLGLDRAAAARFSFLLSTPIIIAATMLTFPDLVSASINDPGFLAMTLAGAVAAALSGYLAIASLLRFLGGHALSWFSLYRIPAGLLFLWIYAQ